MSENNLNWESVYRRTNDPKLAYLEHRLDELGIKHRRHGESAHAPILQVPAEQSQAAWDLLSEEIEGVPLDDIGDDNAMFSSFDHSEKEEDEGAYYPFL